MKRRYFYLLCLPIFLIGCKEKNSQQKDSVHTPSAKIADESKVTENDTLYLNTYFDLDPVFDSLNYHLEYVRKEHIVPRVFLLDIRRSLKSETSDVRKYDFMRIILSNALLVNEHIRIERESIIELLNKKSLSVAEASYLDSLSAYYRCDERSELIEKVDIIPPSLIMCQAIIESGWGQSHFAYEGNSLFGEHAPANATDAIKAAGANIGLRTFPTVYDAIRGYANNLNRHNAYKSLRDVRSDLRNKNLTIDGLEMANTQDHYSELGHEYVNTLRQIISMYNLTDFDRCILKEGKNLFIEILK